MTVVVHAGSEWNTDDADSPQMSADWLDRSAASASHSATGEQVHVTFPGREH